MPIYPIISIVLFVSFYPFCCLRRGWLLRNQNREHHSARASPKGREGAMGASQSTITNDIINQATADAIIYNAVKCTSQVTGTQVVFLDGTNIGNTFSQDAAVNVSCLQSLILTTDMASFIASSIQQAATANNVALLPAYSGADSASKISNYVEQNLNLSNIVQCAGQSELNQVITAQAAGINIGNIVTQKASVVSSCIQNALNSTTFSSGLTNDAKNNAVSDINTNPLSSLFSGISTIYYIVMGIIIIIILAIVYSSNKSSSSIPSSIPSSK